MDAIVIACALLIVCAILWPRAIKNLMALALLVLFALYSYSNGLLYRHAIMVASGAILGVLIGVLSLRRSS